MRDQTIPDGHDTDGVGRHAVICDRALTFAGLRLVQDRVGGVDRVLGIAVPAFGRLPVLRVRMLASRSFVGVHRYLQ